MSNTPTPSNSVVTEAMLAVADALDCFWNAAIGAAHERQSSAAMDIASIMADGIAAVSMRLKENATLAMQSASTTGSDELADDIRYIAAHTNDPRHEERLYEAADVIEAAKAIRRLGYGLSAPQSEHVATTALNAIATPDTDRVAVLERAVRVAMTAIRPLVDQGEDAIWRPAVKAMDALSTALSQPLGSQTGDGK